MEPLPVHIIGLMSGTSLDGLDIAHCTFSQQNGVIHFELNACETISFSDQWRETLQNLHKSDALEYASTHVAFGRWMGSEILNFNLLHKLPVDYVASHGHTVFHQPAKGFTSQIGDGAALAAECGVPVICDFRSGDVAHGGQGAPLVPIGDSLLFGEYGYCLNLGGFANISFDRDGKRIAYDICPVNIVMNRLAGLKGLAFDRDGFLASSGAVNDPLLTALNALPYYQANPPKSLGREWVDKEISPLLQSALKPEDLLRTLVEHIAIQIRNATLSKPAERILVTGGGARNRYLLERLQAISNLEICVPEERIIDFKEALIFAFLGYLRVMNKPNCLSSVTGATRDVCGGAIYLP